MSTNVRISELTGLDTIDNGGNLVIPVSKNNGSAENKQWTSYNVSGDVLSKYVGSYIGIDDIKRTVTGLQTTTSELNTNLQTTSNNLEDTNTNLTQLNNDFSFLETSLGKYYDLKNDINFGIGISNNIIDNSGELSYLTNYFVSEEIELKQGKLYLLHLARVSSGTDLPGNISILSKVHTHEYDLYENETGDSGTTVTYEPLQTYKLDIEGQGLPDNRDLVFFANEDMKVVISAKTEHFPTDSDRKLTEIKYGSFMQIANNLLGVNGELMKVLVEAIVKNRKDIDVLYANANSLGKVHVNSIDCDEYPSVQGGPMVRVENRAPSAAEATHGPDVPNRIGQIWVDTNSKNVYIAVALGGNEIDTNWKLIS